MAVPKGRRRGDSFCCGRINTPGVGVGEPMLVDYSEMEATADQVRIEEVIADSPPGPDSRVLHVGVGNSQLAQRFASSVGAIDGLSVAKAEREFAASLQIPNYGVRLVSKYSGRFLLVVRQKYDLIVDNNLASYACCRYHLYTMFDNYRWCLRPGGRILTDQEGMQWTASGASRWQLSYEDLERMGELFGLVTAPVTDMVNELRRIVDTTRAEPARPD